MMILSGDPHLWELPEMPSAVAVGVFDGVHRGHQAVLAGLRDAAAASRIVALTFDPHPLSVVAPERAPRLLGTVDQRIEWLQAEGVDVVGVLPFDRIREWSAEAFVDVVMRRALHAELVCIGSDFRFGYDRSGDAATLRSGGFEVHDLPLLAESGERISSTGIRAHLAAGEVAAAAALIGRPHTVRGPVVRGDGRGRTIGVPTANLAPDPRIQLPANGVYAARVSLRDGSQPAVVNVGVRPTFGGDEVRVEAHLLDGDHDLYGRSVDVAFIDRIRGEQRFDGVDALVAQIHRDIEAARSILET